MKPISKKLLLGLSIGITGIVALTYAFDPLHPEQHRLCSGLPQHASWDVSEGNKSVVWSYLGDLLNVVVPDGIQIGGALTPRTTEGKSLCTFVCDYGYKLDEDNQTCVEDPDIDPCPTGYYWNKTNKKCEISAVNYPSSIVDGYNYAYDLGIEAKSINEANLYDSITKQELTKIITIWTKRQLNHPIDNNIVCNITDINEADGDYVEYITEACKMGIIENNTAFHPYETANYAMFLTAVSRALWGDRYDGGDPYYSGHFEALKSFRIVNNPDPDQIMLRGYAYSIIQKAKKTTQSAQSTNNYPPEFTEGYLYAYELGIEPKYIDDAHLYDGITKQEIAKIITIWADKELSHTIDNNASCNIPDINEADGDYVEYIIKACKMGLIDENTAFHPYSTGTNAIFYTVLSRALWGELYDGGDPYYKNHFLALKALGIIGNPDPDQVTIRGYAYHSLYAAMYSDATRNETILENKISDAQTFDRDVLISKTVFSGLYTTVKSSKINGWVITAAGSGNRFGADDATFHLFINGTEVNEMDTRDSAGFSNGFTTINLLPGESVTVKVSAEIYGATATGTYNYALGLFDLSAEGGEQKTTPLVPIIVTENGSAEMNILSDVPSSDVIAAENNVVLGKFIIEPKETGSQPYIDNFSLEFDKSVNLQNLSVLLSGIALTCEDVGENNVGHQIVECNNVNYRISGSGASIGAVLQVKLANPEVGVYRTTLSGINGFSDFYSIRRLVANPVLTLLESNNDGTKTTYSVQLQGSNRTISNIKLYTEDYSTAQELNNATPIISVNQELTYPTNYDNTLWFDNLDETAVINTISYDSNGKTIIINKNSYPEYFINHLGNLTINKRS